ncbi:unnamed protein product [Acanthoscelides obtectus]|uniref:Uncharacterized protein n=1 Tax=Acanthoscelides obtectus TaxID=200917 RepID=A0A9P0M8Z3_ACAOB|nr:unnamed protein product [Acanthoscelides obtectus]CAK1664303.1 hypothetical protein AOBTE_LOCUS24187 [Acanthoscelides obtectus]
MPNKKLERLLQKNMYKKMMGDQQLRTTKLMMFPKYLLRRSSTDAGQYHPTAYSFFDALGKFNLHPTKYLCNH